ncbi:Tex2, putative integral membrane protein, with conserved DUF2404 domain [Cryphonectria parasitica EP155]|uniref:Tex2, putative integral membrane protein, with conserved DUF2404 domain n=1 Tax=Cryphonectria parasitica (strain ATCC 38755 / EP155) TaxID=660469 RepID=A0A9P4XSE0_CRYP1|nr:Tex2, putative integral membrane protein, with conserved DUF2404 domain [Cryphonectria parasitica EP155]KAF3760079.1 Tex2, putative integral membrane protein, with conserved DUF2404 domain [Cryphonectria parasitica EP155]
MGSWTGFLLAYLLGGVTFLPLIILVVLAHAHLTLPYREDADPSIHSHSDNDLIQPGDDLESLKAAQNEPTKGHIKRVSHSDTETAAGYFAVCREYTPMGINAKPIERSTPVGSTTVAAPSQSVYQAMYRSIFDRKQQPGPLDNGKSVSQRPKKAGNVFFVVLRHGHLMLFDDDEQLEVRHVISLAHHDVSIYSGGDVTPEGELFIKRNAICLSRRPAGVELAPDSQLSKPFYLFSENCSAKEDFYFALLRNQEQAYATEARAPAPLSFDVKHIIRLVQRLHSSEDHVQSRWLNAMVGRIFLGLYRTADTEAFIREKLNKKISRVKRPAFLPHIEIRNIDTGDSAPYFTNLRHRDLTVEGECSMEADMPKMEMTIEPIVSSRQITYTVILRQIEARIKEVVAETLVLPFWDDTPFFKTEHKKWRGGIFAGDDAVDPSMKSTHATADLGEVDDMEAVEADTPPNSELPPMEKSQSMPIVEPTPSTSLFGLKLGGRGKQTPPTNPSSPILDSHGFKDIKAEALSTGIDTRNLPSRQLSERSAPLIVESAPVTGTEPVNADVFKPSSPPGESPAASAMAKLSARTKTAPLSGPSSPLAMPERASTVSIQSTLSSTENTDKEASNDDLPTLPRRGTTSSTGSMKGDPVITKASPTPSINGSIKSQGGSFGRTLFTKKEGTPDTTSLASTGSGSTDGPNKKISLAAVTNAAGAAKRWGWNALHRNEGGKNGQGQEANSPEIDLSKPMGGGRPLPPPGMPLPMPEKKKATAIPVPKRKPIPPPTLPERQSNAKDHPQETKEVKRRAVPPPPLPRRRRQTGEDTQTKQGQDMLVVAAPDAESEPTTPIPDEDGEGIYRRPFVEDAEEDELDSQYQADESLGNSSSETPPALPSRNHTDVFSPSQPQGENGEDDEYSAWMDNTGEDEARQDSVPTEKVVADSAALDTPS